MAMSAMEAFEEEKARQAAVPKAEYEPPEERQQRPGNMMGALKKGISGGLLGGAYIGATLLAPGVGTYLVNKYRKNIFNAADKMQEKATAGLPKWAQLPKDAKERAAEEQARDPNAWKSRYFGNMFMGDSPSDASWKSKYSGGF